MKTDFKPFDKVLVRDGENDIWTCALYSHYDEDADYQYQMINGVRFNQCIPFEGNEHLVGTDLTPKEKRLETIFKLKKKLK